MIVGQKLNNLHNSKDKLMEKKWAMQHQLMIDDIRYLQANVKTIAIFISGQKLYDFHNSKDKLMLRN